MNKGRPLGDDPSKARTAPTQDEIEKLESSWVRGRPSTPEDARERLRELSEALDRAGFYWAAAAFGVFLAGIAHSLNEAFGLKERRTRGRPVDPETVAQCKRVLRARLEGQTWEMIAESEGKDERELQRALNRHLAAIWIEALKDEPSNLEG
jgi:hypothetical protein